MKKNVSKVGRPKLADKDLKVNSFIMCLMGLVLIMSLIIGAVFSFVKFGA